MDRPLLAASEFDPWVREVRVAARKSALAFAITSALTVSLAESVHGQAFPSQLELSQLDGTNGFVINGEAADDRLGYSVSSAGDINGDGVDDLIVGAPFSESPLANAGRSYVLFGATSAFPAVFDPSTLDGTNGFIVNGESITDRSGGAVASAGDVNNDGIDDLIIGARRADSSASNAGKSYLVFGSDKGFPASVDLASLDGSNGVVLLGEAAEDDSGSAVAAAGDVNGDGIDDVIIGARFADPNGEGSGRSYVIFGSDTPFSASIDLSLLDGLNGFAIDGEAEGDESGVSVSGAGDVNGDGIGDLLIGARRADINGADSGRAYVIFGSTVNRVTGWVSLLPTPAT